ARLGAVCDLRHRAQPCRGRGRPTHARHPRHAVMEGAANERAIAGVLACTPRLVGVKPALEVVPGMRRELILHAGPPAEWDALSPVLRAGIAGAAEIEGLAQDEVV